MSTSKNERNTNIFNLIPYATLEEYFSSKKHSIDKSLCEQGTTLEKRFYKHALQAIRYFISNASKSPVILFDIDDTILCRDLAQEKDYIRPSFLYLARELIKEFPEIILGTLSQRRNGPPLAITSLFNKEFITCSHGCNKDIVSDDSYSFQDGSVRAIYIEKVNAYLNICKQYPHYSFFLVDDILSNDKTIGENPLVNKGHGYAVKKDEKFLAEYQFLGIAI